jgi:hypothetical protein
MSAAARAKLSREMKGRRHPHKGHRMSAATREKISRALKGKHHKKRRHHHKGHKESAATRAKIAAKLRADAARRRKARTAKDALKRRRKVHVSHHRGTTFGPHRRHLHKRPPHYIRHRRTTGRHVRLARMHRPHPQQISRRHRLKSLDRRRRKFG